MTLFFHIPPLNGLNTYKITLYWYVHHTIGLVLSNTNTELSPSTLSVSYPLAVLKGGAYCMSPVHVNEALRFLGGASLVLLLVEQAQTTTELSHTLLLFNLMLESNAQALKDTAR